ncbi:MAG: hypothetical protein SNJ74_04320 [Fimbriimonadaceae bacterium]
MFDLWKDELTPEETETLVRRAADEIRKRKLEAPAILFLELHKPLAYVGSQAAIVFSPFIVPFLGFQFVNDYSRLFSCRENVEKLLVELERRDDRTEG